MDTLKALIAEIVQFRNDRDWEQFHNPKDLSLALSIEAAELNELFLWKQSHEADRDKIKEELADIFMFGLLLANQMNFDFIEIIREKLKQNAMRYPVEKSKGKSTKYTDL